VLGLDIGTTRSKALLLDAKGMEVAVAIAPTPFEAFNGRIEAPVDGLISAVVSLVAQLGAERERVEAQVLEYKLGARVHMVEGGDHRQESVGNALAALECDDDDVVLVHDAVRPLIDPATIERTIDAVVKHGAAIVGLPAVDTIKQVERTAEGAIVTATIPRERIVHAQTPQGATFGLLRRAFIEAEADGFAGTDEASLLERAGIEVAVVPGSPKNFKITQPGDIELAEFYLGIGKA